MAYGFNDDKSIFNIDAALLQAKREAVASARDLEVVSFENISTLRIWARGLGKGVYNAICYASTSVAVGLPNSNVLLTVYNDGSNITYINAKCISLSSIFYELVYDMFFNGSTWSSWRRDFDDILPGDVVSIGTHNTAWVGKGLNNRSFRITAPIGRKIRANSGAVSGDVRVACMGTLEVFRLNARPTTPGVEDMYYNTASAVLSKETNSVIVQVNFDMDGDLVHAEYPVILQNDTTSSNKLTFTFS